MCHTCLPWMLKVACSVVRLILRASNPEVTEMVACTTFMIHMLDESLLPFGHPCDSHVRYDLSHSKAHSHLLTFFQVSLVFTVSDG